MTISINNSNKIETTLFEKRLNLHLDILPHSAHPPGLLRGIVYGTLFRILPYVQMKRTKYKEQRFFLNASLHVATKESIFGHFSTKQSCMPKHTMDRQQMRTMTTIVSSSTYCFIQTILHHHLCLDFRTLITSLGSCAAMHKSSTYTAMYSLMLSCYSFSTISPCNTFEKVSM